MKIIAFIVFLVILASLASALFNLVKSKDQANSEKIVKALTVRIALSLLLFILIFVAFATGLIEPHGIGARVQQNRYDNALKPQP